MKELNKMDSERHWSKFKRQWIEDAMRWCDMTKTEALNYWEQQEYRGE